MRWLERLPTFLKPLLNYNYNWTIQKKMPRFRIKEPINLTWDQVRLLTQIAEKYYGNRDITDIMRKVCVRNTKIIIKLWEYYLKHNGVNDLCSFIDDEIELNK